MVIVRNAAVHSDAIINTYWKIFQGRTTLWEIFTNLSNFKYNIENFNMISKYQLFRSYLFFFQIIFVSGHSALVVVATDTPLIYDNLMGNDADADNHPLWMVAFGVNKQNPTTYHIYGVIRNAWKHKIMRINFLEW